MQFLKGKIGKQIWQRQQGWRAVLGCTGLQLGCNWAVLGCNWLLCTLVCCCGLYWALLGCSGLYWAVLSCTVLCWKWKIVHCYGKPETPILHWQSQLRWECIIDIAGIISRISNILRKKYPEPKRNRPSQLWMGNKSSLQIKLQSILNIQNIWNI